MNTKFRSKVDRKLGIIGIATPCVALIAIYTSAGHNSAVLLPLVIVTALVSGIVVWIVLSTYYEITGDVLMAHSGPFSWRIPLEEITGVCESDSVRSGPALSMDRLEIAWGEKNVLTISPQDKATFLAALRAHAPRLAARS
ncbi:MAG TPA: PH domain-containing protein [Steroidobacteraceae bacterium]|nr:PH domain-containing protein [Steroidobacteraceae bacterium]